MKLNQLLFPLGALGLVALVYMRYSRYRKSSTATALLRSEAMISTAPIDLSSMIQVYHSPNPYRVHRLKTISFTPGTYQYCNI